MSHGTGDYNFLLFLVQCNLVFLFHPLFSSMNCPHCNTELPDNAAFCAQCGCPITHRAFFPPDSLEPPPSKQHSLLIGTACVVGAVLFLAMFVGLALFGQWMDGRMSDEPCCGVAEGFPIGADFPLYGKTLNDENLDWESLRGKYVLVKFTATWCGPCKGEIPGMLEAYEKYHDKGLEIVSVYIWEQGPNAAETVKKFVEREELPWIIVSEALTEKTGQPPQGKVFDIQGVPTMVLLDKEGKVHAAKMRGGALKQELKRLFDE